MESNLSPDCASLRWRCRRAAVGAWTGRLGGGLGWHVRREYARTTAAVRFTDSATGVGIGVGTGVGIVGIGARTGARTGVGGVGTGGDSEQADGDSESVAQVELAEAASCTEYVYKMYHDKDTPRARNTVRKTPSAHTWSKSALAE